LQGVAAISPMMYTYRLLIVELLWFGEV